MRTGHEPHGCFLTTHLHVADPPNTSQSAPLGLLATLHALVQSRIDGGLVFHSIFEGEPDSTSSPQKNEPTTTHIIRFRRSGSIIFSTLSNQVNFLFCYPSCLHPGALPGF